MIALTLGVMRFLQMEWHNHERARNAWDIERAEMKIKIAKQEGENRSLKKLNEALEKQIRMLEKALKTERAAKRASVDEIASEDKETNGEEQEGGVKKGKRIERLGDVEYANSSKAQPFYLRSLERRNRKRTGTRFIPTFIGWERS